MGDELRKSGIEFIGDVPWATHFCQFYRTRADLLDILVPYFKAGLENNEFCMWVTAEPLTTEQAKRALSKAVPGLSSYLKRGQIEIIPYTDWYVKDGVFNQDRVLKGWVDKLNLALAKGFAGLRLTGNTFWLEREDWKGFTEYEAVVDSVIGQYKMLALCTYSLDKCGAAEVIDVVRNHEFALVKQESGWEMVERSADKRSRQALAQSEERFRRLYESSVDGIVYMDMTGRIVDANRSLLNMLGYTLDEIRNLTYQQITPTTQHAMDDRVIHDLLAYSDGRETEYIKKDGTVFPASVRAWLVNDDNGNTSGMWGIIRNISRRRLAEEQFRRIVRTAMDAFSLCDSAGRFLEVNDSFCALSGYDRDELRGISIFDIQPKELTDEAGRYVRQAVKDGRARFEGKFQHKGGRIIDVDVSVNFMPEAGGRFFVFVRDITERKQVEIKLREAADQWSATFNSINDMISIHDREFRVVKANWAFIDVAGMTAQEVEGKFCYQLIHKIGMPVINCPHVQTLQTEKTVTEEIFDPTLGKYLEVTTSPVFDKGEVVGSVHIARDITPRKKTEEEIKQLNETLKRQNADLETANKEMESFSYSVSHDLRAPLRSMEGFSQALLEDYGNSLDAQGKDYLKRIQSSSRLMAELIDDILQLSRMTRSEMRVEALDFSEMAQSIVTNLRNSQPERQVEFVAIPDLVASGDRKLMRVVLENLLSNAWKFSSKKRVAKIEFGATWSDGKRAYFVRDNGAGFDMTYVGKLFGAFQRLHSNADFPGNGIGLATMQRIVHHHGGRVWAEGKVGKGATFYFTLD